MSFNRLKFNQIPFNRSAETIVKVSMTFSTASRSSITNVTVEESNIFDAISISHVYVSPIQVRDSVVESHNGTRTLIDPVQVRETSLVSSFGSRTSIDPVRVQETKIDSVNGARVMVSPDTVWEDEQRIAITLPIGDILVIDSAKDEYTVKLNGIDIFDTYSGDFIFLEPFTEALVISADNISNVSVQVIYTDAWK